jgi:hypothetical protein
MKRHSDVHIQIEQKHLAVEFCEGQTETKESFFLLRQVPLSFMGKHQDKGGGMIGQRLMCITRMRPPTNHQSGWGCTFLRKSKTYTANGK